MMLLVTYGAWEFSFTQCWQGENISELFCLPEIPECCLNPCFHRNGEALPRGMTQTLRWDRQL